MWPFGFDPEPVVRPANDTRKPIDFKRGACRSPFPLAVHVVEFHNIFMTQEKFTKTAWGNRPKSRETPYPIAFKSLKICQNIAEILPMIGATEENRIKNMPAVPPDILPAFEKFGARQRAVLLTLRQMIFDVAQSDPRIGSLEEALRWGEPAYLTSQNKTGSTIRLGVEKTSGLPALFFNCNTSLVEGFRQQFGNALKYSKNRAVLVDTAEGQTNDALRLCIAAALTYHLRKKT
ncbi:hypothetical protein [Sulfitobacter pacificus]|uniref:hypothetical protein n=1 Tax=Sulfitobacter pacificus TaxID=1499314 RepID=UPI0024E0FC2A|nr:hypothetical protein [Sulfitobacter pacificus]